MSEQMILKSYDFSDFSFEHFCYEFSLFIRNSFSDLSEIKSYISTFEKSLSYPVIPKDQFISFLNSISKTFNLSLTLPDFVPKVNFLNLSIFF